MRFGLWILGVVIRVLSSGYSECFFVGRERARSGSIDVNRSLFACMIILVDYLVVIIDRFIDRNILQFTPESTIADCCDCRVVFVYVEQEIVLGAIGAFIRSKSSFSAFVLIHRISPFCHFPFC